MRFFLKHNSCFLFLLFFGIINSQIQQKQPATSLSFEAKEKLEVTKAYQLFNSNEDKLAYKKAHSLVKKGHFKTNVASANLLLAYYFNKRSLIDSSLFYTQNALKSSGIANDSLRFRMFSLCYNLLAINYKKRGLLEESKKWHIKGIEASEKFKETDLYYTHLHGLALAYSDLGNYQKSLQLFKECLQYKQSPEIIIGSYINIGDIYSFLKEYDKSNTYLNKVKNICAQTNDYQAKAVIAHGLAVNYSFQKRNTEALELFKEAIALADKNELTQIGINSRLSVGNLLLEKEKTNEAKIIFFEALITAKKLGYFKEQMQIYEKLKDIYATQNDYKNAYNYSNKIFTLKDSLAQLQKDKEINELEVKFKTWQKEKEINLLQIQNKASALEIENKQEALAFLNLQKKIAQKESENKILSLQTLSQKKASQILSLKKDQLLKLAEINWQKASKKINFYSFLAILLPIFGFLMVYNQRLKSQKIQNENLQEINQQKMLSLVKDQEIKLIKASIQGQEEAQTKIAKELHDSIGGNLAAIKLQLATNEITGNAIQSIQLQLDETYQQVRNLSHNLIPKKFSEQNFCLLLENYLKNLANNKSLQTTFTANPKNKIDLLPNNLQMELYKIIQELTTNTLKHAKASSIELHLNYFKNNLNILFEDNGIGFETKHIKNGIGINNIRSRLMTFSGALEIDSVLKRGTIVNINIPLPHNILEPNKKDEKN